MQAYAADLLAIGLGLVALLATFFGRLPQRQGIAGVDALRAKAALVGAGAGAIPAAALAHELAGPGALLWLAVGLLGGGALLGRAQQAEPSSQTKPAVDQAKRDSPRLGRTYAGVLGLVLAGAWLLRSSATLDDSWVTPLALWGVAALTVILAPPAGLSTHWLRLPTLAFVLTGLFIATQGELGMGDFFTQVLDGAFNFTALAAGTGLGGGAAWIALAAQQGLVAASHSLGLAYTEPNTEARHARSLAWASSINAFVVAAITFFVLSQHADASGDDARFDAPQRRAQDGRAHMMSGERPHMRMFLPSPKGQSIVAPADTPLKSGHRYRALFRANPRGYKIALFSEERNAYALAKFNSTAAVDHLLFRDQDPQRSKSAAWDLRVPVKVEEMEVGDATPVLQLTPQDPDLDFASLAKKYDGPYVPLADITLDLVAMDAVAGAEAIGAHLALVQAPPDGPTVEFTLEQMVPMGFRGPFFDLERPAGPLVFAADPALQAKPGERLAVEYRAPEAGLELGRIRAGGQLELPGWTQLQSLEFVVFHHESGDPNLSFMVPVQPAPQAQVNGLLRFVTNADAPTTLHKAAKLADYRGPYVALDAQPGWVEVRSGQQLADEPGTPLPQRGLVEHTPAFAQVLVPIPDEAQLAISSALRPASAQELIEAGMRGPFARRAPATALAQFGGLGMLAAWLAWAFAAWMILPTTPKLRALVAVGTLAGLVLPFAWLYSLWLLSGGWLLVSAWTRRARA